MGSREGARRTEDAPPSAAVARSVALVAPLVFGSGLCALVYQIAWQREFRLIFGASTAATAAVVAMFMGGLGLGALLLGPRADRQPRPLRFYARARGAHRALTALATPALLVLARRAYLALGGTAVLGDAGGTALRLVLAALSCCAAHVPRGRHARRGRARGRGRSRRRGGAALAVLYGVNTLGAVAGCVPRDLLAARGVRHARARCGSPARAEPRDRAARARARRPPAGAGGREADERGAGSVAARRPPGSCSAPPRSWASRSS